MHAAQPLRGRDSVMVEIGEYLDGLLDGSGMVVVIEGAAGLGKTRLLQEAMSMASTLSIRVGVGSADPADTIVQMSPLMEALFEGSNPILQRDSLSDTHISPEQRYWLIQDIEELLERAALEKPILICLDDVQWADSGTAAALRTLPSRLATLPLGWLITLRPDSGSPSLRSALDYLE